LVGVRIAWGGASTNSAPSSHADPGRGLKLLRQMQAGNGGTRSRWPPHWCLQRWQSPGNLPRESCCEKAAGPASI